MSPALRDEPRRRRPPSSDAPPIDRVIGALERGAWDVRPTGSDSWEARCPHHQGSRRNLTIKVTSDGTVLLRCHHVDDSGQACPVAAILAELGLEVKDLFPTTIRSKTKTSGRADRGKKALFDSPKDAIDFLARKLKVTVAGRWVYRVDSRAVMVVYRIETVDGEKEYRPIGLDLESGLWKIGDPAGRLPLYRLDDLASVDRIWMFEGEKLVELARALGLVSTTTAHGAKSPSKSDLAPLSDKDVIIVLDHDDAGEGYGKLPLALFARMEKSPRSVRILRLPGLVNEGDDLEQWLGTRRGVDSAEIRAELEQLADACPVEDLDHRVVLPTSNGSPSPSTNGHVAHVEASPPKRKPRRLVGPAPSGSFPLTDLGNSERLVSAYGHMIRYCGPWGVWLEWDGRRWKEDRTGAVERLAKRTVRQIHREADGVEDKDERAAIFAWELSSESRKRIDAMIALARSDAAVAVVPEQLNADPMLFNVENGTIDLKNGELLPHRQSDLITKLAPVAYNPAAQCPRWAMFEREVFAGDDALIGYTRRKLGYSLTALDVVQELDILFGDGANGKSVYLDTVLGLFGEYACQAAPDILMYKDNNDHPTGIADLDGRRFVAASETEAGRRLAESLVKRLTGDKIIKGRRMRQDFYEFKRTFKVFLAFNHKPRIRGSDHGIWRRIRLIPFRVKFVGPGKECCPPFVLPAVEGLADQLAVEAPGILALLVRACLEWQRDGMQPPPSVESATDDYKREMDLVADFIADRCVVLEGLQIKASLLYNAYRKWCDESGVKVVLPLREFGQDMEKRGYHVTHTKSGNVRAGIDLAHEDQDSGDRSGGEGW